MCDKKELNTTIVPHDKFVEKGYMGTMQFWTPHVINERWAKGVIKSLNSLPFPGFVLSEARFYINTSGGDTVATRRLIQYLSTLRSRVTITTFAFQAISSGALIFLAGNHGHRFIHTDGIVSLHGVAMNIPVWMLDENGKLPEEDWRTARDLQVWAEQHVRDAMSSDVKSPTLEAIMRSVEGEEFGATEALRLGLASRIIYSYKQEDFLWHE